MAQQDITNWLNSGGYEVLIKGTSLRSIFAKFMSDTGRTTIKGEAFEALKPLPNSGTKLQGARSFQEVLLDLSNTDTVAVPPSNGVIGRSVGGVNNNVAFANASLVDIIYSSSDTDIFTVHPTDGSITIVGAGSATLSAFIPEYTKNSITYEAQTVTMQFFAYGTIMTALVASNYQYDDAALNKVTLTGGSGQYLYEFTDVEIAKNTHALAMDEFGNLVVLEKGEAEFKLTDIVTGDETSTTLTVVVPTLETTRTMASLASNSRMPVTGGSGSFTWVSSDPAVATIDVDSGIITPLTVGTTQITVTDSILSTTATPDGDTGDVVVQPVVLGMTGTTVAKTATSINFGASGGSGNYNWTSSDTSVIDYDYDSGQLIMVGAGTALLLATDTQLTLGGTSTTAQTSYTVTELSTTGTQTVAAGADVTWSAQDGGGSYTWTSEDESIATVTNAGVITGVSAGAVLITCQDGGPNAVVGVDIFTRSITVT